MQFEHQQQTPPAWQIINSQGWDADRVLSWLNIAAPPVDVRTMVFQLGAHLHESPTLPYDGATDSRISPAGIFVNTSGSAYRQRFTIAHEIGHLLLHGPGQHFRDDWSSKGTNLKEIQANAFAADLLMPSWMVHGSVPGQNVPQLAGLFSVSQAAMSYRLNKLGYIVSVTP